MRNDEKWLETDAMREAVLALEMVAEQATKINGDPYRWKWTIIALHNAVQGFMVLALRGTTNLNVIPKKDAEAWLQAYSENKMLPLAKLDRFLRLYKKIKSNEMIMWTSSTKYVPSGQQGRSIKKLNRLRNDFVHFLPKNHAIATRDLPSICADCVTIVRFLGWDSGNVFWQFNEDLEQRALVALDKSQGIMEMLAEKMQH